MTKSKSYLEMATDAILNIKSYLKGASRVAIRRYINTTHKVECSTIALRLALKKGVSSGLFVREGNRYKLDTKQRASLRKAIATKKKPKKKKITKEKITKEKSTKEKTNKKHTNKKTTGKKAKKPKKKSKSGKDPALARAKSGGAPAPARKKSGGAPALKRQSSLTVIDCGLPADSHIYIDDSKTVWEANLAVVDMETNTDKFYKLQVVEAADKSGYWCLQQWGRTGTAGQTKVCRGSLTTCIEEFEKIFKSKAGVPFAERDTYTAAPGKYSCKNKDFSYVQKGEVMWKYYVDDGVDGKATGWYDYAKDASATVEEVYRESKNQRAAETWLNIRSIQSGHFSYKVDFTTMQQTNLKTHKMRMIKRSVDGKWVD